MLISLGNIAIVTDAAGFAAVPCVGEAAGPADSGVLPQPATKKKRRVLNKTRASMVQDRTLAEMADKAFLAFLRFRNAPTHLRPRFIPHLPSCNPRLTLEQFGVKRV